MDKSEIHVIYPQVDVIDGLLRPKNAGIMQNKNENNHLITKMKSKCYLILSISILLIGCQSTTQTAVAPIQHHCKDLHKVKDIDDLMYQMYINSDSQCLFEMPTADLASIWGIPIFDYTVDLTDKQEDKTIRQRQKLDKKADTLILLKMNQYTDERKIKFSIQTTQAYSNRYAFSGLGGSFERGQFPPNLPVPEQKALYPSGGEPDSHHPLEPVQAPAGNVYRKFHQYAWGLALEDKSKPRILMSTGAIDGPSSFIFYNCQWF